MRPGRKSVPAGPQGPQDPPLAVGPALPPSAGGQLPGGASTEPVAWILLVSYLNFPLKFKFSSKTSITLSERRDCVHEDPGAGHLSTRPGCLLLAACPAVRSPPPSPALARTGALNRAGLPAGCGPFPLAAHGAAESQEAQLLLGSCRRESECRARTVTHLTLQRHVVDLGVQQHGAGAERHRLVRDGSRCPAVNPQDLLLAGDYELFLEESSQMSRTHPDRRPVPAAPSCPPPPLTRSMLCCSRSFPLTASCCLNSSFRGSARVGGGAICNHGGGGGVVGEAVNLHQEHQPT